MNAPKAAAVLVSRRRLARGFTLVELIVVMVVIGALGAMATSMIVPAIRAHASQQLRAKLAADVSSTMSLMTEELRSSVPNSVRSATDQCVEFVPTIAGGRYRMQPDTTTSGSHWLTSSGSTSFDVLTALSRTPAVGDWIVINNITPAGVFGGTTRTQITSVNALPSQLGSKWLGFNSFATSGSYDGGRFAVVSNASQAVTYYCLNVTGALDASGNASGKLLRRAAYGFVSTAPTSCPGAGATLAQVVLDNVSSCKILYTPNEMITQQSGYVGLRLAVTRSGETQAMSSGAHIDNVP